MQKEVNPLVMIGVVAVVLIVVVFFAVRTFGGGGGQHPNDYKYAPGGPGQPGAATPPGGH